jgi:hypothetical protein
MDREISSSPREWGDTSEAFVMHEDLGNTLEVLDGLPNDFPNRELIRSHIKAARELLPRLNE